MGQGSQVHRRQGGVMSKILREQSCQCMSSSAKVVPTSGGNGRFAASDHQRDLAQQASGMPELRRCTGDRRQSRFSRWQPQRLETLTPSNATLSAELIAPEVSATCPGAPSATAAAWTCGDADRSVRPDIAANHPRGSTPRGRAQPSLAISPPAHSGRPGWHP
jgi:hypothetical protein